MIYNYFLTSFVVAKKFSRKHFVKRKECFTLKIKNLEEIGLVVINSQETEQTAERLGWLDLLYEIADHWGDLKAGFRDGWHTGS